MFKRTVIVLTFLAYALTLAHSLVPHRHDDEAKLSHHHHHENGTSHHHHDEDEQKSLSHSFEDAIHHPSSGVVIQSSLCESPGKKCPFFELVLIHSNDHLLSLLRPPDTPAENNIRHHSSGHGLLFQLRGPPVM